MEILIFETSHTTALSLRSNSGSRILNEEHDVDLGVGERQYA